MKLPKIYNNNPLIFNKLRDSLFINIFDMTLNKITKEKLYKYKGNYYCFLRETKIKNPETREWIDGILYFPINEKETLCVREKREFEEKFEKVIDMKEIKQMIDFKISDYYSFVTKEKINLKTAADLITLFL